MNKWKNNWPQVSPLRSCRVTLGKNLCIISGVIYNSDYNEANYDEYFEEREEKIERGDIVVKDYDAMNESVSQFEAIDWSIFGDYTDYYYDY